MTTKKQLRHCSAWVYTELNPETGKVQGYMLQSYNSRVAWIGINQRTGEMWFGAYSRWNYSNTTMSHIRKFVEDYMGEHYNITEMRRYIADPDNHKFRDLSYDKDWWFWV